MKTLTVVAYQECTGRQYARTLQKLFGDTLEITSYSIIQKGGLEIMDSDLILASTYSVCELLKQYTPDFSRIIIAAITLGRRSMEQLRSVPAGSRALLVNVSLYDAIDTISLIHQCGISHINFIPSYPPFSQHVCCDLAVTPGETQLVPSSVSQVIDLGDRILSMKTITEIAFRLNMGNLLRRPSFQNYFDSIIDTDISVHSMLNQIDNLEKQLELIAQVFDSGIISLDTCGTVVSVNARAASLLNLRPEQAMGKPLDALLPAIWENGSPCWIKDKVIKHSASVLIVSVKPIQSFGSLNGYLTFIKQFKELEQEQNKIRKQLMPKGHTAKYTFDDIIGKSPAIQRTKELAKRMARSCSSILIYGETGTGKELFAQSIHNASPRRHEPFIAINCAAIPENLLESELFGYEGGAFTGAKKSGKSGFFEQAHKGTLFLDEISEMNIHLQTRLLRVLQEREITRIGGDSVINVDVRIIAASNKRLHELVRQSAFRKDLYYRLNVLNIQLPPLDSRREDIPLLIEQMKKELEASFTLTDEAMKLICSIHYDGNVRELRNLVERLIYSEKDVIDPEELKCYLEPDHSADYSADSPESERIRLFLSENDGKMELLSPVLKALSGTLQGNRLGRAAVVSLLAAQGIYLSEQEVRTAFRILSVYRLIQIGRGRGGTKITELGLKTLQYLDISRSSETQGISGQTEKK